MPIYNADACDVLEAMTSAGFEFARDVARSEGMDLGLVILGDQADAPPSVIVLAMPPGHVLERHAHDAYRVEIVVKGSVVLPDGRELRPGDVSTSAPMEHYGPLTAGPEGSLTVEVFSSTTGLVPKPAEATAHGASIVDRITSSLGA